MVIIIVGEYGSRGKEVAKTVAEQLNYRYCDDATVNAEIEKESSELSLDAFRYFDESEGAASLAELRKLSNVQSQPFLGYISTKDRPMAERLSKAVEKTLGRLADEGNCVIMGRCADYYLKDRKDTLCIFMTDPLPARSSFIADVLGVKPDEAEKIVTKVDTRRAEYYRYFTRREWADMRNYHMILQVSAFGVEGTAAVIGKAVERRN